MNISTGLDLWNVWTVRCRGTPGTFQWHCSQSCVYSDKTAWYPRWKIPLKTPGNAISETLNFHMSLDASALKNLCLWCEFQGHLLFIISLLLKKVLTALTITACYEKTYLTHKIQLLFPVPIEHHQETLQGPGESFFQSVFLWHGIHSLSYIKLLLHQSRR